MTQVYPILSTINSAPVSYFIYSALSFFGPEHGGSLPGMWFIRALNDAGRDAAAVRQTLYRMEREGELLTRKEGRSKFYHASGYAKAEIAAGTSRIFQSAPTSWDGRWTIVHLRFRQRQHTVDRERVVALLGVDGFAQLSADTFIHPRADAEAFRNSLPPGVRPHVIILRGRLIDDGATSGIVELWDVADLGARYEMALARLTETEAHVRTHKVSDKDAFLLRFAVVFEYLGVAWDDPGLPSAVLPRTWSGEYARIRAARLYRRLLPGAKRHAENLLRATSNDSVRQQLGEQRNVAA